MTYPPFLVNEGDSEDRLSATASWLGFPGTDSLKSNLQSAIMAILLITPWFSHAQLHVTISPVRLTGHKAVVPLSLENRFLETVESARAVVFLLDERGKAVSLPTTRWVVGGSRGARELAAGATNTFHFVVTGQKPFTTTNLTAKVAFSRVVLDGGKLANANKDVVLKTSP